MCREDIMEQACKLLDSLDWRLGYGLKAPDAAKLDEAVRLARLALESERRP